MSQVELIREESKPKVTFHIKYTESIFLHNGCSLKSILLLQPDLQFQFVSVFPRQKFDFLVICGGHSSVGKKIGVQPCNPCEGCKDPQTTPLQPR